MYRQYLMTVYVPLTCQGVTLSPEIVTGTYLRRNCHGVALVPTIMRVRLDASGQFKQERLDFRYIRQMNRSNNMNDGKEEIELDLDQKTIDYLNERATLEDKTVDEVVEDILRIVIAAYEE
jgi:hypothetical protein